MANVRDILNVDELEELAGSENVLIEDAGTLKRFAAANLGGGGAGGGFSLSVQVIEGEEDVQFICTCNIQKGSDFNAMCAAAIDDGIMPPTNFWVIEVEEEEEAKSANYEYLQPDSLMVANPDYVSILRPALETMGIVPAEGSYLINSGAEEVVLIAYVNEDGMVASVVIVSD